MASNDLSPEGMDSLARRLRYDPDTPAPPETPAPSAPPAGSVVDGETHNMRVILRVRPMPKGSKDSPVIDITGSDTAVFRAPKVSEAFKAGRKNVRYQFTQVMGPQTSQDEMFAVAGKPLTNQLLAGKNGLLFAYGVTNSGKTHTIHGSRGQPGVVFRALEDVLTRMDSKELRASISYMEIYNEKIFDLLNFSQSSESSRRGGRDMKSGAPRRALQLLHNRDGDVYVKDLKSVPVTDLDQAIALLHRGQSHRKMAHTDLHNTSLSSRSHVVFTITLHRGASRFARLSMVDLAGAERVARSGNTTGIQKRELININRSLMNLGRCLEGLRHNQTHPAGTQRAIPFRDSQITHFFKDSLLGDGDTVMVATANPRPADYDETVHAMRYTSIAREIKIQPKVNTHHKPRAQVSRVGGRPPSTLRRTATHARTRTRAEVLEVDVDTPGSAQSVEEIWDTVREKEEKITELLEELYATKQRLVKMEARVVQAETDARAEVCEELGKQMMEMEEDHAATLAREKKAIVDLYEQKMIIRQKQFLMEGSASAGRSGGSSSSGGSSRQSSDNTKKILRLESQLHDREVKKLNQQHQEQCAKLRSDVEAAKEAEATSREHLERARNELRGRSKAHELEVTTLRKQLHIALQEAQANSKSAADSKAAEAEVLAKRQAQFKEDVARLQQELQLAKKSATDAVENAEAVAKTARAEALEVQKAKFEETLGAAKAKSTKRIQELEKLVQDLKDQMQNREDSLNIVIADLQDVQNDDRLQIKALQGRIKALKAELDKAETVRSKETSEHKKALEAAEARASDAETRAAQLTKTLQDVPKTIHKAAGEEVQKKEQKQAPKSPVAIEIIKAVASASKDESASKDNVSMSVAWREAQSQSVSSIDTEEIVVVATAAPESAVVVSIDNVELDIEESVQSPPKRKRVTRSRAAKKAKKPVDAEKDAEAPAPTGRSTRAAARKTREQKRKEAAMETEVVASEDEPAEVNEKPQSPPKEKMASQPRRTRRTRARAAATSAKTNLKEDDEKTAKVSDAPEPRRSQRQRTTRASTRQTRRKKTQIAEPEAKTVEAKADQAVEPESEEEQVAPKPKRTTRRTRAATKKTKATTQKRTTRGRKRKSNDGNEADDSKVPEEAPVEKKRRKRRNARKKKPATNSSPGGTVVPSRPLFSPKVSRAVSRLQRQISSDTEEPKSVAKNDAQENTKEDAELDKENQTVRGRRRKKTYRARKGSATSLVDDEWLAALNSGDKDPYAYDSDEEPARVPIKSKTRRGRSKRTASKKATKESEPAQTKRVTRSRAARTRSSAR